MRTGCQSNGWARQFPGVHRAITNAPRVIAPDSRLDGPAAAPSKNINENFIAPVSFKSRSEKIVSLLSWLSENEYKKSNDTVQVIKTMNTSTPCICTTN